MNKSKKTLAVFALGALIFAVTACNNPFFPKEKEREGNSDGSGTRGTDNNLAVAIAADVDGVDVTLTAIVTGSGNGTLSYQWYSNLVESSEGGTRLSGATAESYEPPTDIPGTTYYYVEVTNRLSGQTIKAVSNTVGVVVREEGEEGYEDEPIGIIVSEPVDTPVVTIAAESDGGKVTLTAFASISDDGTLSYQWYRSAVDRSDEGAALSGATDITYTPPASPNGTVYYYVKATNTFRGQAVSAASHTVKIVVQGGKIVIEEIVVSDTVETPSVSVTAFPGSESVTLTASASVVDGGTLSYRWYKNTDSGSKGGTPIAGATGMTYEPPMGVDGTTYYYVKATNTLKGQTADAVSNTVKIVIRNGDIAIEEIIVSATVETPLVNVSAVNEGGSITITAAASVSDGGVLSYRWYKNTVDNSKNGALIASATEKIYTPPTEAVGTAYYYVKVTNSLNGQTADTVSGTVKIIVQSGGITEVIISDAVKTPLVGIAAVVNDRNVTITASASVGDRGTLSYQWYRSTVDDSKSGTPITGATETTYTYTPPTGAASTTYYYVKVTNTLKGQTSVATSNIIGVVIRGDGGVIEIIDTSGVAIPQVTIAAAATGRSVTIMAAASVNDGGTLSYQWYHNHQNNKNGTPINGATGIIYAPPTASVGTTYYYVRVTNTLNGRTAAVTSNVVGVVVPTGGGSVEILEPLDVDMPAVSIAAAASGRDVTITATASVTDGGILSYQWHRNNQANANGGTEIDGATETTYAPPTSVPGTVYYYVKVTNTLNGKTATATSNIVGITVPAGTGSIGIIDVETPDADIPQVSIAAENTSTTLTLTATATVSDGGEISYQWYSNTKKTLVDGEEITGATGETYAPPTGAPGTTYYYVQATNTLNGQTASAFSNIMGVVVPEGGVVVVVEAEVPVVTVVASPSGGPYGLSLTVTLMATAEQPSDGGALTYRWYSNTTNSATGGTLMQGQGQQGVSIFAPTNAIGTTYYYCVATNTLQGKSASATSNVVEVEVIETVIRSVAVSITPPATGMEPDTYAMITDGQRYTASAVAWTGTTFSGGTFDGNQVYTATVTLTANEGFTFASDNNFTAMIRGNAAVVSDKTETSVTIAHTFGATSNSVLDNLTITAQPTTLTYQHGGALDLTGLKIKLEYSDGTILEDSWDELSEQLGDNLTANPEPGTKLSRVNGETQTVTINAGGKTANTGNVTVNRKGLVVSAGTHTKPFDSTNMANGITVTRFTGIEFNDNVNLTVVNGNYNSVNAGTNTVHIIAGSGTRTGTAADYYTVVASTITIDGGGITKVTPTVTWPDNQTATYGQLLSDINPGGNGTASIVGAFTWTTSSNSVGNQGTRTHAMTFTPTDTVNYNTVTGNASITVNAKTLTLVAGPKPTRTLIPFASSNINEPSNTTTFSITVSGLVDSDTVTVNSSTTGFRLSNNTGFTNSTAKTVTVTYSGSTSQALAADIQLSISGDDNYTGSVSLGLYLTINSGMNPTYPIEVTANNISGFNSYAAGNSGLTRHYKLMADVTAPATWTQIGTDTAFTGTFDGNGKTITGLAINYTSALAYERYVGMFGRVSGSGIVKNLGLKNVNIVCERTSSVARFNLGGVAGKLEGGTVENCFVTGTLQGIPGGLYVGGVVGYMTSGTVQNCYATASIDCSASPAISYPGSYVGGVVGYMTGGTVQNCYSTGALNSTLNNTNTTRPIIGGVVGNYTGGTVTKCVALNSSIINNNETAATNIGRVYNGTGTGSYNYGKAGMTITYNNGSGTYSPTSSANGKDGETTSTAASNSKNPSVASFWTTNANWGTAANSYWNNTTIWDTTNVATNGRPLLRGFTANIQTN